MSQFICHMIGDFLTQSDWMAKEKTSKSWPALCHASVYSLPFMFIASWPAMFIIWSTHFLIDRFRLVRYVLWAKNFLAPKSYWFKWEDCKGTGYHKDSPPWLSVWLMIHGDNTLHFLINFLAIKYFP